MTPISREEIAQIIDSCQKDYQVFYEGKALFVEWELPCGFTIGARAAMVDPSQFDLGKGLEIARERAIDQLWQFESYRRSANAFESRNDDE